MKAKLKMMNEFGKCNLKWLEFEIESCVSKVVTRGCPMGTGPPPSRKSSSNLLVNHSHTIRINNNLYFIKFSSRYAPACKAVVQICFIKICQKNVIEIFSKCHPQKCRIKVKCGKKIELKLMSEIIWKLKKIPRKNNQWF